MESAGSISCWIEDARRGCEWAGVRLWERYHEQILSLARRKIGDSCRSVSDEEDVAVIAFNSFLRRSRTGAYPDLRDRDQLWKLLVTITVHKARNQLRNDNRHKRGGEVEPAERPRPRRQVERVSQEPDPDRIVMVADSMDRLLDGLADRELRQIAIAKLNGYSNQEIADSIHRSLPTVERRLSLIRDRWREELSS